MHNTLEFLLHHGYALLLLWVFAEQIGLPVPALPVLLAAGAVAGTGRLNFFGAWLICVLATLFADSIWYLLGRSKGIKILHLLCKISLEPDSCVRKTEGLFAEQGSRSLLFAKFLPGLGTMAPPLAGIFRMKPYKFLLFDGLGASLWSGTFLTLGYVFSGQIEDIAEHAATLGSRLLIILVGALAAYILWKYIARRHFLAELRIARITVDDLKSRIDAGEDLTIVDLRHSLDFDADPETIPGALRMDAKEIQAKSGLLPRDREIILFCT
ncbi:MAG TPA: VTT domain-containing protein [Candidatus Eremiobacteraceae bacterium]|nr:VTT domain-containing protein [Candidatus Eremiobacteraceae bacterium]